MQPKHTCCPTHAWPACTFSLPRWTIFSPPLPHAQVLAACVRTLAGQAGGRPLSPALRDLLQPVVTLYALHRLEQASD